MCAFHLYGTSLFDYTLRSHPWKTSSQNCTCYQS